jgi:hypothetical protein
MKLLELHNETMNRAERLLHEYENFLHHIAEEELVACKVHEIKAIDSDTIAFIADCNDDPRKEGYQEDLSLKLRARLSLHAQLAFIDPRVYHKNIDPR